MKQTPVSFNSTLKRSAFGAKKRAMVQSEVSYYPTFEHLLRLHRLEWWHNYNAQRSQPGWPDYTVFGDGWLAFIELKAVRVSGTRGKLSEGQRRYKAVIEAAGGEYRVFVLPQDWNDVDDFLCGHTGLDIRDWAQRQRAGGGL